MWSDRVEAACNQLARDHAVLERACDVNFVSRSFFWAWAAIRLKRAEARCPAVEKAHSMFEMFCGSNSSTRRCASASMLSHSSVHGAEPCSPARASE